jgi:hypothetical protein
MRHLSISVAALLALTMLAPAALAFDVDTKSGTNPDGSARYADPDDAPLPGLLGAITAVMPGAQFGGSSSDSSSSSAASRESGSSWNSPQLGRVTR